MSLLAYIFPMSIVFGLTFIENCLVIVLWIECYESKILLSMIVWLDLLMLTIESIEEKTFLKQFGFLNL